MRPEVKRFAELMEAKLKENDFKGGWRDDSHGELFRKLDTQVEILGRCSGSDGEVIRAICWGANRGRE